MPVNFMMNKVYKIDYKALHSEVMGLPAIFSNEAFRKMYIDKWIEVLKIADENTCNSFSDPRNKELIEKENVEAPEKFQTIVNFISNQMYIHFRVSRIGQILKSSDPFGKRAQDIEIDDFVKEKQINWTSTEDLVSIKSEPIIIVPFTIDKTYKMLVVDGNHRITDTIEKGKKTIKSYLLDTNYIVQSNFFCSEFDKMLYVFQNEVVAIATWIQRDGMSDEEAIKNSYFVSGIAKVC